MTQLMKIAVPVLMLALGVAPAALAAGPQCVAIKFVDAKGVIVPTNPMIIGLMVAGRPVAEGVIPANTVMQPGAPQPCPADLIAKARGTFEDSCITEDKRNKAMAANKVDRGIIDKGCAELLEALATEKDDSSSR